VRSQQSPPPSESKSPEQHSAHHETSPKNPGYSFKKAARYASMRAVKSSARRKRLQVIRVTGDAVRCRRETCGGSTVGSRCRRCRPGLGQADFSLLPGWGERRGSFAGEGVPAKLNPISSQLPKKQTNNQPGGTQNKQNHLKPHAETCAESPAMSGTAEPRVKLFAALVAGRGNEPEILAQVEEATRLGAKSGRIVPLVATPKIVVALAPSPPQVLPRPSALSWPRASVARSANAPLGSSAAVALKAGRCG